MPERRNVLIISTMFFPYPGVGGVRMTQWARLLPRFGWNPTVLTRYYGHYATTELIAEHLRPSVTVEYLNPPSSIPAEATKSPRGAVLSSGPTFKSRMKSLTTTLLQKAIVPDMGIFFWRKIR